MKKLPELNLNHLFNLTDETGLFQHARYQIPNRRHGYCIDDNARALLVLNLIKKLYGNGVQTGHLLKIYLSFIDDAYNPSTKKFRNFMSYERKWLEESGSEDSQGRTIWAIGTLVHNPDFPDIQPFLEELMKYGLEIAEELTHPRAIAYSLLGWVTVCSRNEESEIQLREKLWNQANQLRQIFTKKTDSEWLWHDENVTYDNCRIPQALISSGSILRDYEIMKKGIELLDWLIKYQFENGIFIPIGNENWLKPNSKSHFDQQPIEAWGMIDACCCAGKITRNPKYYEFAATAFDWFLGGNLTGKTLYDNVTGGCCDGLNKNGTNQNQGAESMLAWLHSLLMMKLMEKSNTRSTILYNEIRNLIIQSNK